MNLKIVIRYRYYSCTNQLRIESWCELTPLCMDYNVLRKYQHYIYCDGRSMMEFYFSPNMFTKESGILYQVFKKLKEKIEHNGISLSAETYYHILHSLFKRNDIASELHENYVSKVRHVCLSGIHSDKDDLFDKILRL